MTRCTNRAWHLLALGVTAQLLLLATTRPRFLLPWARKVSNAAVSAVCQPTITATTRPCLAPAAGLAASLLAV